MKKHALKALSLNMCIFLFLLSALPLPDQVSRHAGLITAQGVPIGDMFVSPGGNLAGQLAALIILGAPTGGSPSKVRTPGEGFSEGQNPDFKITRFVVRGNTLKEMADGVRNAKQISGTSLNTEGKNYAAYAFADYTVEYIPYITACYTSDGRVEVELSAIPNVSRSVQCGIPDYRTSNPQLARICEAEEARLLAHETEHYKAYVLVGEALADSLIDVRVTGSGPNLWMAIIQARLRLDRLVMERLSSTVQLANNFNRALDIITNHGLGIGPDKWSGVETI